jgi:hypothetical protein
MGERDLTGGAKIEMNLFVDGKQCILKNKTEQGRERLVVHSITGVHSGQA